MIEKMHAIAMTKKRVPERLEEELLHAMHDIAISCAARYDKAKGPFDKFLSTGIYYAPYIAMRSDIRHDKIKAWPIGVDTHWFDEHLMEPEYNTQDCIDAIDKMLQLMVNVLSKDEMQYITLSMEGYTHLEIAKKIGVCRQYVGAKLFDIRKKLEEEYVKSEPEE